MNKKILLFFAVFVLFLSFSPTAKAVPLCQIQNPTGPAIDIDPAAFEPLRSTAPDNSINNFITSGSGLVPCGISIDQNNRVICACQLEHIFVLLLRILRFLLLLSTVIAGLMITIGGVLIVLSGINQNWMSLGKTIIWWSIIGVVTMFAAWLIINTLMVRVLGTTFNWNVLWF